MCISEGGSEAAPRRNRKEGSEYKLVKNRRSPQLQATMSGKNIHSARQKLTRSMKNADIAVFRLVSVCLEISLEIAQH